MESSLKKALAFRHLVLLGIMAMNPIAGLSMFGFTATLSEGNVILTYFVAFVAMSFTALSYSKMVELFPSAGSSYTYVSKGIHKNAGFLAGWLMLLDYVMIPATTILQAGLFLNILFPSVAVWIWLLIIVTFTTIANYFGVQVAAKVNNVLLAVITIALLAFVGCTIYYVATQETLSLIHLPAVFNQNTFGMTAVFSGAALGIMCYFGFEAMTTLSEETKITSKQVGIAAFISLGTLTLIFMISSYLATLIMPDFMAIQNIETAISEVIQIVGGDTLNLIILIAMIMAFIGISLIAQSSASRLLFAKGRDGALPKKFFAKLHPKHQTPYLSIILLGIVTFIVPLVFPLLILTELISFGGICGFIMVNLAVIIYNIRQHEKRKIFINYVCPALGLLIMSVILVSLSSNALIVGGCWIIVGIGTLLLSKRLQPKEQLELQSASIDGTETSIQ